MIGGILVSLGTQRVKAVADTVACAAQRLAEFDFDAFAQDLNKSLYGRVTSLGTPNLIPLVARAAPPTEQQVTGKNRSYIQVVSADATLDTSQDAYSYRFRKYDRYILTSAIEQDAEKMDVVETFGAPHLFASGRFMRRLQIGGLLRANAISPTDRREERRIIDRLSFQRLYDNYLRGSVMARKGLIARLYIDGDIYEGWFSNLQLSADAQMEQLVNFSMSMLVLRKNNKNYAATDAYLTKLLGKFEDKVTTMDKQAAQAELANAQGVLELKLVQSASERSAVVINFGAVDPKTLVSKQTLETLYLAASGSMKKLTVTSSVPQLELKYADGTPVTGRVSRDGQSIIKPVFTSYPTGETHWTGQGELTITGGSTELTIVLKFDSTAKIPLTVSEIKHQVLGAGQLISNRAEVDMGPPTLTLLYQSFIKFAKPDGATLTEAEIRSLTHTVDPSAFAALGSAAQLSTIEADKNTDKISVPIVAVDFTQISAGYFGLLTTVTLDASVSSTTVAPFVAADRVAVSLLNLRVSGRQFAESKVTDLRLYTSVKAPAVSKGFAGAYVLKSWNEGTGFAVPIFFAAPDGVDPASAVDALAPAIAQLKLAPDFSSYANSAQLVSQRVWLEPNRAEPYQTLIPYKYLKDSVWYTETKAFSYSVSGLSPASHIPAGTKTQVPGVQLIIRFKPVAGSIGDSGSSAYMKAMSSGTFSGGPPPLNNLVIKN
jgi:hypothetical protein